MAKPKFNRQYLIAIQYGEHPVTEQKQLANGEVIDSLKFVEGDKEMIIRPSFTINFTVDRGIFATMNKISLDIYNLAKSTRHNIYYDGILHGAVNKRIIMYAGYSDKEFYDYNTKDPIIQKGNIRKSINGMPLVFFGRFTRAYSYRQGTNIITHIEAFDLPEKNEVDLSTEFKKGTTQKEIFSKLAKDLNIGQNNLKVSPELKFSFTRDKSFSKKTTWDVVADIIKSKNELIKKEQGNNAPLYRMYFDYPDLVVLKDNEYIQTEEIKISAETGLLSTPIREGATVKFTSLFEPAFRCGGSIYLDSRTTETGIGGRLKVVGFKHSGTISPAVCDSLKTEFTCFMGIDKLVAQNV